VDGTISVITPGGTATTAGSVDVTASPPPAITFATPGAQRNTKVVINGPGLQGVGSVTFNGVPAEFTILNDRQIQATVPLTATSGAIIVTSPGGVAVSPTSFTVPASQPPRFNGQGTTNPGPGIEVPAAGPTGSVIFVNGTTMDTVYRVEFNSAFGPIAAKFESLFDPI